MLKQWRRMLWLAGIAGSLGLGAAATAQTTPFQPFKGIFGSKTAPEQKFTDANRVTEIQVELAWLSDRGTFPYSLEAHIKGTNLEVRGYVPNKAIHDQAINLAKLNCPMPLTDSIKEHANMAVRPARRSPDQLKQSVQSSLKGSFPGQKLDVQCQIDGTVQITGNVRSLEQKLAVSQSIRRLHGCTSVTNFTQIIGGDMGQQANLQPVNGSQPGTVAKLPASQLPATQTPTKNTEVSSTKTITVDTPVPNYQPARNGHAGPNQPGDPYESQGVVVVSADSAAKNKNVTTAANPPVTPTKTSISGMAASASQIKKRIETSVTGVRNVSVTFTSKTNVHVECTPRPGDDSGTIAGQILSLKELEPYKVDLQIQLPDEHK